MQSESEITPILCRREEDSFVLVVSVDNRDGRYVSRIVVVLSRPGRSVVSLHGFDDSAEAGWSHRSELLASSPQFLPSGRRNKCVIKWIYFRFSLSEMLLLQWFRKYSNKLKEIVHRKVQIRLWIAIIFICDTQYIQNIKCTQFSFYCTILLNGITVKEYLVAKS